MDSSLYGSLLVRNRSVVLAFHLYAFIFILPLSNPVNADNINNIATPIVRLVRLYFCIMRFH